MLKKQFMFENSSTHISFYPNFNTAITKLIDNGWPIENFKIIKKHIAKSLKK